MAGRPVARAASSSRHTARSVRARSAAAAAGGGASTCAPGGAAARHPMTTLRRGVPSANQSLQSRHEHTGTWLCYGVACCIITESEAQSP